jgi:hypothetical protein
MKTVMNTDIDPMVVVGEILDGVMLLPVEEGILVPENDYHHDSKILGMVHLNHDNRTPGVVHPNPDVPDRQQTHLPCSNSVKPYHNASVITETRSIWYILTNNHRRLALSLNTNTHSTQIKVGTGVGL